MKLCPQCALNALLEQERAYKRETLRKWRAKNPEKSLAIQRRQNEKRKLERRHAA
jgi:hypothetical protein